MARLIIIHGPAASGKSTVAKSLVSRLEGRLALLEQDMFFVDLLRGAGSSAKIEAAILIEQTVSQLIKDGYTVIMEGIFNQEFYLKMLKTLSRFHTQIFYLKASLDIAKQRHESRPKAREFGVDKIEDWYDKSKPTGFDNEKLIEVDNLTTEDVVTKILESLS